MGGTESLGCAPLILSKPMSTRSAYNQRRRGLVLAFDVGTTFSGISYRYVRLAPVTKSMPKLYSILEPGEIPVTKGVTK